MADSKPGSFSAYLEYSQRKPEPSQSPSSASSLLGILLKMPNHQTSMGDLAAASGMSATAFREALQRLVSSGFIEISGESLSEVVVLTDKGRQVAELF